MISIAYLFAWRAKAVLMRMSILFGLACLLLAAVPSLAACAAAGKKIEIIRADEPEEAAQETTVALGIDVLVQTQFAVLRGRKIALISNHTGVSSSGQRTADVLFAAARRHGFEVRKLFAPEHGFSGKLDEKFSFMRDERTGLPIISLYGQNYAPRPEDLEDVDDLLFDIQDIGTRFYTYQATMALAMRVAAGCGKRFIVLDRPNPIGGELVQGAVPPPEQCGGLTSIYPVPTRHGMTIGELAYLYNEHFSINCRLVVAAMSGWRRSMLYDETGLAWINPSPNMRSLEGAIFYPGLGTSETTSLSVGRNVVSVVGGTTRKPEPFELYGAAFVGEQRLARELNAALRGQNTGINFLPVRFLAGGKTNRGVQAVLQDRKKNDPILAGLCLARTMLRLHPRDFRMHIGFSKEVGDPKVEARLRNGESPEAIIASWQPALEGFMRIRAAYLLYP
jgi:beta-N-acetylhexosaminidase